MAHPNDNFNPIGKKYRFDYPSVFVTLPDYTAHAGQEVLVTRLLQDEDEDIERIFEISAADGWKGEAFESELGDL